MPLPPPDPLYTIRGQMSPVHSLLFKKNTDEGLEILYVGTSDGIVHLWELSAYREISKIVVGSKPVLAIHHKSGNFITQEKGGDVKVWKEEGLKWRETRLICLEFVGFCKITYSDHHVICPGNEGKISLYPVESRAKSNICPPREKLGQIMCLKYLQSSDLLLGAYESGSLFLWDLKDSEVKCELRLASDCPMALDFSEVTNEGVYGSNSEELLKFSLKDGRLESACKAQLTNPGVSSLSINPGGKLCAAGCWDGRIRYFSMKKLKLLAVLDYHVGSVECVKFSDRKLDCTDCIVMSAGGKDGKITLWTLYC